MDIVHAMSPVWIWILSVDTPRTSALCTKPCREFGNAELRSRIIRGSSNLSGPCEATGFDGLKESFVNFVSSVLSSKCYLKPAIPSSILISLDISNPPTKCLYKFTTKPVLTLRAPARAFFTPSLST